MQWVYLINKNIVTETGEFNINYYGEAKSTFTGQPYKVVVVDAKRK